MSEGGRRGGEREGERRGRETGRNWERGRAGRKGNGREEVGWGREIEERGQRRLERVGERERQ